MWSRQGAKENEPVVAEEAVTLTKWLGESSKPRPISGKDIERGFVGEDVEDDSVYEGKPAARRSAALDKLSRPIGVLSFRRFFFSSLPWQTSKHHEQQTPRRRNTKKKTKQKKRQVQRKPAVFAAFVEAEWYQVV